MDTNKIYAMPFGKVYPLYLQKIVKKGRTQEELDSVIAWLTGYDPRSLHALIAQGVDFETFFKQAPAFNSEASKITGLICGYRVEEIKEEGMWKIRCLDKLVDELAKGKSLDQVMRK